MKPASPLPWVAKPAHKKLLPLIGAENGKLIIFNVVEQEDLAYIAHAANAYPRLVEALKWMAAYRDTPSDFKQLLRDLGEL